MHSCITGDFHIYDNTHNVDSYIQYFSHLSNIMINKIQFSITTSQVIFLLYLDCSG